MLVARALEMISCTWGCRNDSNFYARYDLFQRFIIIYFLFYFEFQRLPITVHMAHNFLTFE